MDKCGQYMILANLYGDGPLSDSEEKMLADHLKTCPVCAERVKTAEAVRASLSESEPPENLSSEIMRLVSRKARQNKRPRRRFYQAASLAAACAAVVVVYAVYGGGGTPRGAGTPDAGSVNMFSAFSEPDAGMVPENYAVSDAREEESGNDLAAPSDGNPDSMSPAPTFGGRSAGPSVKIPPPNAAYFSDELLENVFAVLAVNGSLPEELSGYAAPWGEDDGKEYALVSSELFWEFSEISSGELFLSGTSIDPGALNGLIIFSAE